MKKILSLILTIAMVFTLVPGLAATASAGDAEETIGTVGTYKVLLPKAVSLPEDANSTTDVTSVTGSDTSWGVAGAASWYAVSGTVDINNTVTVNGDVHLILKDGCNLTVKVSAENQAGICVSGSNSLTIYVQSAGSEMGKLTACGGACAAGIGGGYGADSGNITINGGKVTAVGGSLNYWGYCDGGAGIGGGYNGDGKNITINGGAVIAQGGYYAAGIGGGYNPGGGNKGNGEHITINGGTVSASGGNGEFGGGAGIGGGIDGIGSYIAINGGTVIAACGNNNDGTFSDGAAIGNGHTNRTLTASNIKVSAALTVKAGNDNPPSALIEHTDSQDLASSFVNKHYATIMIPHIHCICGEDDCSGSGHNAKQQWTEWTKTDSLPSEAGYYYLGEDVTISTAWYPVSGTYLCLNGHVIQMTDKNQGVIIVNEDTEFTLTDCKDTVHYFNIDSKSMLISYCGDQAPEVEYEISMLQEYDQENAYFKVLGGCITGGFTQSGGGIVNLGTFNMYSGNIVGNGAGVGGGIANGGDFNLYGGNISGNCGAFACGGVFNSGTFNMFGGTIDANFGMLFGGGVYNKSGSFNMSGGTICRNKAAMGSGVINNVDTEAGYQPAFNMTGGSITENTAIDSLFGFPLSEVKVYGIISVGGGVYNSSTMTVGGTAKITKNFSENGVTEDNLYIAENSAVSLGTDEDKPADEMNIKVTMEAETGKFTSNGNSSDVQHFKSDNKKYSVAFNKNHLELVENKIKYVLNGGSWAEGYSAPLVYNAGETALPNANNIVRKGFEFEGWYDVDDRLVKDISSYTGEVLLYAKWKDVTTPKLAAAAGAVIGAAAVGTALAASKLVNEYLDKKDTSAAGAVFVSGSCPKDSSCPLSQFTDLDTHKWYHDGIHYCVENELIKGYPGKVFEPNGNITRVQLLTVLWRLAGKPSADYLLSAKDVEGDEWYIEAVRWAKAEGICDGRSEDVFGPNEELTREEFADILFRYAKYKGFNVSKFISSADASQFEDLSMVSDEKLEGMYYCIGIGVIGGNNGRLNPKANTTRAEASAMLQRFCETK